VALPAGCFGIEQRAVHIVLKLAAPSRCRAVAAAGNAGLEVALSAV
jgi:hypothetical protein